MGEIITYKEYFPMFYQFIIYRFKLFKIPIPNNLFL